MFKPYKARRPSGFHEAHERIEEHAHETFGFPNVKKAAKERFGMPNVKKAAKERFGMPRIHRR